MESWVALEVSFSSTLKKNLLVWISGLQKLEVRRRWEGRWGRMCKYQNLYIIVSQLLKWSSWSWMHKMHVVCRNLYIFVLNFRNCVTVCDIYESMSHPPIWLARHIGPSYYLVGEYIPLAFTQFQLLLKTIITIAHLFTKVCYKIMWKQSSKKTESQLHM
jgi:hypothetical protein